MNESKKINRTISFEEDIFFKIQKKAKGEDRTFSNFVNLIIKEYFKGVKK